MPSGGDDGKAVSDNYTERPFRFAWSDWKEILLRAKDEISKDNIPLIAAGIAFYAMLALFPGIAALIGLYGLIAEPADVTRHINLMSGVLPADALGIIRSQTADLASTNGTNVGLASLVAIALAIWGTRSGVNALVAGLNIAYGEQERRGILSRIGVTLVLTIIILVIATTALATIIAVPAIIGIFRLGEIGEWIVLLVRWPVIVVALLVALAIFYCFGPHRTNPRIAWISWGAVLATFLWIVGSAAFSVYVANFASYNKVYGSLGAVVGLLMWLYLSAFIVLLGAEINSEMERQTRHDTTTGPDKPMGERGAYAADTVA
ncbi:MAG: YihY/virulence factor BrkB family protein [Alphaproteobacteria bacterium]